MTRFDFAKPTRAPSGRFWKLPRRQHPRSFHRCAERLPAAFHPALEDLENICEEERQLSRQRRLYHWLHAWLLVHVPLSIALLVLGGIHAVMALRY